DCPTGGKIDHFFAGNLQGPNLEGKIVRCTHSKQLVDDCHLNSVWETTFKASATTVSERPNRVFDAALSIHDELVSANDAIQGTWFAEGWGYDVDNGHFVNCHRDSRFGGDEPLGLYRHCWYSGLDWV